MTSRLPRTLAVPALAIAALGLSGCYDDGYGYYGGGVGYSSGYYGSPYGYGGYGPGDYGYGYGWYDNYWYPGSGVYIYDRFGGRHGWRDRDRDYWHGRDGRGGRGGPPPQGWNGQGWQGPRGDGGGRRGQGNWQGGHPSGPGRGQWQGNGQGSGSRNAQPGRYSDAPAINGGERPRAWHGAPSGGQGRPSSRGRPR